MRPDQFPRGTIVDRDRRCPTQHQDLPPGTEVEVMQWSEREEPWVGQRFTVARHDKDSGLVVLKQPTVCVLLHWEALRPV